MSLQTLPRFADGAAPFVFGQGVTPAQRGRAAVQIRQAAATGRLATREVRDALQRGDVGVAQLLRKHARLPAIPRVAAKPFDLRLGERPLSERESSGVARLVEVLASTGDLQEGDLVRLRDPMTTRGNACDVLAAAWNRRVRRVLEPLYRFAPANGYYASTVIYPEALATLRYMANPHYAAWSRSQPQDEFPINTMGIEPPTETVIPLPGMAWDVVSTGVSQAAWDSVVGATKLNVAMDAGDSWYFCGGFGTNEHLMDLATTCAWNGDDPMLDADELELLEQEAGYNIENEEEVERIKDALRYFRSHHANKRLVRGCKSVRDWMAAHPDHPITHAATAAFAITDVLKRSPWTRQVVERDEDDECGSPILALPGAFPLFEQTAWNHNDYMMQIAGGQIRYAVPDDASLRSVNAFYDRLILDAGAVAMLAALFRRADWQTRNGLPADAVPTEVRDDDSDDDESSEPNPS